MLNTQSPNITQSVLAQAANNMFCNKTALCNASGGDPTWTYAELSQEIQAYAAFFSRHGVCQDQRVGILLGNVPGFIFSYFALLGLGAVAVPLNTALTAAELNKILNDAQVQALVSSETFQNVLADLDVPSLRAVFRDEEVRAFSPSSIPPTLPSPSRGEGKCTSLTPILWQKEHQTENISPPPLRGRVGWGVDRSENNLATLIYTSGTTGRPKGVMLTHRSLLADAMANIRILEAGPNDCLITLSPLYHIFGQTNVMLTALLSGATLALLENFEPSAALRAISRHGVSVLIAVPTMYQRMLPILQNVQENSDSSEQFDLSRLRVCHSGAAPMPEPVFHRIEALFNVPVQEGYGLSEASPIVCSNPLHGIRKPSSIGLALPGIIVRVMDETLTECPPYTVGEICVSGDVLMAGYWNMPEETQKVLVKDASGCLWLKTRDLAYRDEEGYLFITARQDDVINIGGQKVYPREIEEVLLQHPDIVSAAVVGIPSALFHEQIKACVVLGSGAQCSRKDLLRFLKDRLAAYKLPRRIVFLPALPQGSTGKILRHLLKEPVYSN